MRFPAEARRDVHVRYTRPSCMGGFAVFTVDFEPLPDRRLGFEFVNPLGPDDIDAECAQEVSNGILLWLIGAGPQNVYIDRPPLPTPKELAAGVPVRPDAGPGLIALRAVLLHSRHHPIDSLPWTHARAGWRAADKTWRGTEAAGDPMDLAP
ncbi:hypothetical protein DTB58_38690 [Streptomyces griseus]|uniref:hypothetical protein n=1 Tax=Streptomyces griseus TaxID=1911 RepID=UPI001C5A3B91|nr:hypothetical protein [Streptomyces griseus]MBW3709702.1 hypothetical protein [Streptomyces griseus]